MGRRYILTAIIACTFVWLRPTPIASAYTANKVWFEFRANGLYRVYVNYTIPELKEFRESFSDFKIKRQAEAYYWDLVRGADFYPPEPQSRRFIGPTLRSEPW